MTTNAEPTGTRKKNASARRGETPVISALLPGASHLLAPVCALAVLLASLTGAGAGWDPGKEVFTYAPGGNIDETLGQIALFLLDANRREGSTFVSVEIEKGIAGYQLRYSDNGNSVVDAGDWLSVRRYRIPAVPDTTLPEGYYKNTYLELVDVGLNGVDSGDCYFIDGHRFGLANDPPDVLSQYQAQIESGISTFVRGIGYQTLVQDLTSAGQTSIRKDQAYEDGSLPARMVLGLDLRYVFRPIDKGGVSLDERDASEEIRRSVGFVYSATTAYTDLGGYQFREIADQQALLLRTYDPVERPTLALLLDALFDTDGDGVVTPENLRNGYTRFREMHEQLAATARGMNRRIVLPEEKLARLRQEYESIHKKPYRF